MAVTQLNTESFRETISKSSIPVIVDFYADWCQPCRRIAPMLLEISNDYEGIALVCKVNVDENPALAEEFSIMSIPFVASFKNGKLHKKVVGVVPKSDLTGLID